MTNEETVEREREEIASEGEYVWFNKNLEIADQKLVEIDNLLRELEEGD